MNRLRVLALWSALVVIAQSQPTSPTPTKSNQEKQNIGRREERPTVNNWGITFYTEVLAGCAIVQLVVLWRQAHYMAKALKSTQEAASAANNSALTTHKSFVAAQRPKIVVRLITADNVRALNTDPKSALKDAVRMFWNGENKTVGRFMVANTGGTKAIITKYYSELVVLGQLPMVPPYEGKHPEILDHPAEVLPGEHYYLVFPSKRPKEFSGQEVQDMLVSPCYIMGWIEYTDEIGHVRRTAFCRRWDRTSQRFVGVADEDYEYAD